MPTKPPRPNLRPREKKSLVLHDLAKLADVDISTVSRALNHDPRVNAERAQAIRELAQRMGYRPRPLRSKQSQAIGLIMVSAKPELPDTQFLGRIAWEAQRVLNELKLHVNLECVLRDDPRPSLPAMVQQNRVDGVLIAGHPSVELIECIRAVGLPMVAINDSVSRLGISCVSSQPGPAIQETVLRLAAWGHTTFGFLMSDLKFPTVELRYHGYLSALRELGIVPDPEWAVFDLPDEIVGGRLGIRQLIRRGPLPTAIICLNDWVALGAMSELQRQGVRIPEEVSLIGHNDLPFCQTLEPTLTSFHRSEGEIVRQATTLLLEHIRDPEGAAREILIEGEMVWRESSGLSPARRAP